MNNAARTRPRRFRKRLRLADYDYSTEGAYYVTICTAGRERIFGTLDSDRVILSQYGQCLEERRLWLPSNCPQVLLDAHIVMPDHIHGIIWLHDPARGGSSAAATPKRTLSQIVGAFKTMSSRDINRIRGAVGRPVWEWSFYERVIRDESELNKFRRYALDNPQRLSLKLSAQGTPTGSGGA